MVTGVLAGLLACAGPKVVYDYDLKYNFTAYKTFDWQTAPRGAAARAGGFDNPIMDGRVKRAVAAALEAKGYRQEAAAPDFLVVYYPVRVAERSHQVHMGLGFGMGPVGVGVAAPVGDRHSEAVGSMVLEVRDSRTRTMVWKATAESALEGADSPAEADDAVHAAVAAMLQKFPPKP
jgi:hypothetical protein